MLSARREQAPEAGGGGGEQRLEESDWSCLATQLQRKPAGGDHLQQGWESDQEDACSKEERRGKTAEEGEMEEEG